MAVRVISPSVLPVAFPEGLAAAMAPIFPANTPQLACVEARPLSSTQVLFGTVHWLFVLQLSPLAPYRVSETVFTGKFAVKAVGYPSVKKRSCLAPWVR